MQAGAQHGQQSRAQLDECGAEQSPLRGRLLVPEGERGDARRELEEKLRQRRRDNAQDGPRQAADKRRRLRDRDDHVQDLADVSSHEVPYASAGPLVQVQTRAVFRCRVVFDDEREEADVELPGLRSARALRELDHRQFVSGDFVQSDGRRRGPVHGRRALGQDTGG